MGTRQKEQVIMEGSGAPPLVSKGDMSKTLSNLVVRNVLFQLKAEHPKAKFPAGPLILLT